MWNFNRPAFTLFGSFLQCFRVIFDLPEGEDGAGEQILTLKQGRDTDAEFALAFAQTGWPDDPLKLHFRRGLCPELQTDLACRDEGKTLDQLIDLAIRIDNMIRTRRPSRGSTFHSLSLQLCLSKRSCKWDTHASLLRKKIAGIIKIFVSTVARPVM